MKKHKFYEGVWQFKHYRKGNLLWESGPVHNDLVDSGEETMLKAFFRGSSVPSAFYVRLAKDTIVETDTLIDIAGEHSGDGYSAQLVERSSVGFPQLELISGDWRISSKEVEYEASGGDIGPVNVAFLATSSDNSGDLLAFVNLPLERTILDGDKAYVSFRVTLK